MMFIVNKDKSTFKTTKECLDVINKFLGNQCIEIKLEDSYELTLKEFKFWIDRVIEKLGYLLMGLEEKHYCEEILEILNLTFEDLQGIHYNEAKAVTDRLLDKCLKDNDFSLFENLITKAIKLKEIIINIRKKNDVLNGYEDIIKNIEIIYGENSEEYKNKFLALIKEPFDLTAVLNFIEKLNQDILKDYEINTSMHDYKPGKPFSFVGHSIGNSSFIGDFQDNLVSASLFNENVTETYKNGYGFILDSKHIISADSNDLYTANWTQDKDEMYQPHIITSLPIFKPRQRVLAETETFNEVILDKFNPIGIFCFTSGAKELDTNYTLAQKLKQNYNLEVYDIDLTLYKDKENSLKLIEEVIKKIEKASPNNKILKSDYDLFLEEFMRLKENSYRVQDIIKLHSKLAKMLKSMTAKELFTGDFNNEEIKYIILNNRFLGVKSLLNGDISIYILERILEFFSAYKENEVLNEIPYFQEFLVKLNEVNITNELVLNMVNCREYSFKNFINILENFSKPEEDDLEEYKSLKDKEMTLQSIYDDIFQKYTLEKRNIEVLGYEEAYYLAKEEYDYKTIDIGYVDTNTDGYLSEINDLETEINGIKDKVKILQKHKLLNRNKIKFLFSEIRILKKKVTVIKNLKANNDRLKNTLERERDSIAEDFKKLSGVDLLDFSDVLVLAKENYDYDLFNEYQELLDSISAGILEIRAQILKVENNSLAITNPSK